MRKYTKYFLISFILFLGITNFSFADENQKNIQYEIQSSLKTKDYQNWIEYDKKYLEALSKHESFTTSRILKEINALNKELNYIKENYCIKTNSGVRIYSHQITGCIHAINTGIKNRNDLLYETSDFEYDYNTLNINPYSFNTNDLPIESYNTEQVFINENIANAMIDFTIKILNEDSSLNNVLKDAEVYMSPYKLLDGVLAYTSRNYIVMSAPLSYYSFSKTYSNEDLFPLYSVVFYHEVGHIFIKKYVQSNSPDLVVENSYSRSFNIIDLDMMNDFKEIVKNNRYNKERFEKGDEMGEWFADAFGFYKTKQFLDINNYKYAYHLAKDNLYGEYVDTDYDNYFDKYIDKFDDTNLIKFDVPTINLSTKEIENLNNNNFNYTTTYSNFLNIKLDENTIDSIDKGNDILLRLVPTAAKLVGLDKGVYIGKINKENPSKSLFFLNGNYEINLEYKDKNTGKTFDLDGLYINIK